MGFYYLVRSGQNSLVPTNSARPKPGFGIGNRNQGSILVSVSELVFPKPKLFFFQNISISS